MGETPHRSWDKESRATEGPEVLLKWEEASTENKPGGVRPGRVPRGPWPYTPPPQALESRGSGMRDSSSPCSPQAQEFHQQMGGGGFGLCPSWLPLDRELQFLVAPTQAPKAGPLPSSPPACVGMVCARRWQKTNPPGWVCRERGNLDTVAAVANGRHTLRLFWGDCCRC